MVAGLVGLVGGWWVWLKVGGFDWGLVALVGVWEDFGWVRNFR